MFVVSLSATGARISYLWASKPDRRGDAYVSFGRRSISPPDPFSVRVDALHNPNTISPFMQKQRLRKMCVFAISFSGPVWAHILGPAFWLMQLFSGRRALASRSAHTVHTV